MVKETEVQEYLVTYYSKSHHKLGITQVNTGTTFSDSQPVPVSLLCYFYKVFKYIAFMVQQQNASSIFKIPHVRDSIEFGGLWEDVK